MKRALLVPLLLLASFAGAASAPAAKAPARAGSPLPPQQQNIIGLSLMDALVAIKGEGLAGLFGYISEANAAPAFADYLFRNQKELKLFLKKGEGDLKRVGGVNQWDKEVFLYMITIHSTAAMTGGTGLPQKLYDRVAELSLAPGVPLATIKLGGKR